MSKYIKLEDAIHNINLEVVGRKEYTGDMKANLFFALDDLPTIDIVHCEDCKRCEKELVIERRADGKETIVNLCNKTSPPTIVPLDFYCKDGAKMKGADDE